MIRAKVGHFHPDGFCSMPIQVTPDTSRRWLIATATGDLGLKELQDFLRTERTGDLRDWPLLFDATAASTQITSAQIQTLAMQVGGSLRSEGPRAPVALVASSDLLFALMRMYQIRCENEGVDSIRVFRSRDEADAWLSS
jgi:hypothetical protein